MIRFSTRSLLILTSGISVYCYLSILAYSEHPDFISSPMVHVQLFVALVLAMFMLLNNGSQYVSKTFIYSTILAFSPAYGCVFIAHNAFWLGIWLAIFVYIHVLAISSSVVSCWLGKYRLGILAIVIVLSSFLFPFFF